MLYIDEPLYKANNVCEKKPDAFPTMCLDFSDDLDVMKAFQFITDNSVVYSIDIDKVPPYIYDSYKRNYDWESKINKYDLRIGKNTNKLMKLQKGYCIYWPWKYTIKELIENEMFGFRVEQLPGKTSSSVNVNIAVNITGA